MTHRVWFGASRSLFRTLFRTLVVAVLTAGLLGVASSPAVIANKPSTDGDLTPAIQVAIDHISADSLKGHLSFIASDLLEGRNTPSRGLDIAAEYIAAQFRRAGLEPAGDAGKDSYFQTSEWSVGPVNNNFAEL